MPVGAGVPVNWQSSALNGYFLTTLTNFTNVVVAKETVDLKGDLKEGDRVVTGEAARISVEGTSNPFATPVFGGGGRRQ